MSFSYENPDRENQELKKTQKDHQEHPGLPFGLPIYQIEKPAFVIDHQYMLVDVSQAFLDFNRISAREIIGTPITQWPGHVFFDQLIGEHTRQALQGELRKIMAS